MNALPWPFEGLKKQTAALWATLRWAGLTLTGMLLTVNRLVVCRTLLYLCTLKVKRRTPPLGVLSSVTLRPDLLTAS